MKKPILLILGFAALASAQEAQRINMPFRDPSMPRKLDVNLMMGSVTVKGYDGNDAVIEKPAKAEMAALRKLLEKHQVPCPESFRKVVSGRKLWNFDRRELDIWKAAL